MILKLNFSTKKEEYQRRKSSSLYLLCFLSFLKNKLCTKTALSFSVPSSPSSMISLSACEVWPPSAACQKEEKSGQREEMVTESIRLPPLVVKKARSHCQKYLEIQYYTIYTVLHLIIIKSVSNSRMIIRRCQKCTKMNMSLDLAEPITNVFLWLHFNLSYSLLCVSTKKTDCCIQN